MTDQNKNKNLGNQNQTTKPEADKDMGSRPMKSPQSSPQTSTSGGKADKAGKFGKLDKDVDIDQSDKISQSSTGGGSEIDDEVNDDEEIDVDADTQPSGKPGAKNDTYTKH